MPRDSADVDPNESGDPKTTLGQSVSGESEGEGVISDIRFYLRDPVFWTAVTGIGTIALALLGGIALIITNVTSRDVGRVQPPSIVSLATSTPDPSPTPSQPATNVTGTSSAVEVSFRPNVTASTQTLADTASFTVDPVILITMV